MTDLAALRLYCPTIFGFTTATTGIQQALPPDLRSQFNSILRNYLLNYGIDGAYDRLNNRSVAQIFAEYQPHDPQIIASGEVDGVSYQLAEPPLSPATEAENKGEE